MEKIAIQGHSTRSNDIIKILESLGGINRQIYIGNDSRFYYYVNNASYIDCDLAENLPRGYKKYTLKEYEQKFLNTMENKRTIQIDLNTAKEWYKQGGDLKKVALQAFSEKELQELPKSWEEYCEINPYLTKDKEFFLAPDGTVTNVFQNCYRRVNFTLSMSSKKRAEQFVVLCKLIQIRDYYNSGWEPNWSNSDQAKYIIGFANNGLYTDTYFNVSTIFAFKTKKLRDEFFVNFKQDLEFIKEFL